MTRRSDPGPAVGLAPYRGVSGDVQEARLWLTVERAHDRATAMLRGPWPSPWRPWRWWRHTRRLRAALLDVELAVADYDAYCVDRDLAVRDPLVLPPPTSRRRAWNSACRWCTATIESPSLAHCFWVDGNGPYCSSECVAAARRGHGLGHGNERTLSVEVVNTDFVARPFVARIVLPATRDE